MPTIDNVSSSENSGPNQGSGTTGIVHMVGTSNPLTPSSNISTVASNPNISIKDFKSQIDAEFKKTLESIWFMKRVVSDIEKKQDFTIEIIKESLEKSKTIDEKVDALQKTLQEMNNERKKFENDEEQRRKEEDLEKTAKPMLMEKEKFQGEQQEIKFSSNMLLAIPVFAGIVGQVLDQAPVIRGFLEFVKASSSLITTYSGIGAGGSAAMSALGQAAKTTSDITKGTSGILSGLKETLNSAAKNTIANVFKYMNYVKRFLGYAVWFDAIFTVYYANYIGGNKEEAENAWARAIGKIVGGWAGGAVAGAIFTALATLAGGPVGFAISLIGVVAAGFAGYYGMITGEEIARALYRWFASDRKDASGLEKIANNIKNFVLQKAEEGASVISSLAKRIANDFSLVSSASANDDVPSRPRENADLGGRQNDIMSNTGPRNTQRGEIAGAPPPVGYNGGGGTRPSSNVQTFPNQDYIPSRERGDPLTWRTNNPGAIRGGQSVVENRGGIDYVRDALSDKYAKSGTLRYATAEEGACELARLLFEFYENKGRKTVKDIIDAYAPDEDNYTVAYIKFVCERLGVRENQIIDIYNDQVLFALMRAITDYEGARKKIKRDGKTVDYFSDGLLWKGIELCHRKYGYGKRRREDDSSSRQPMATRPPVSAGMVPQSYSPSEYAEPGTNRTTGGVRYDKSAGRNEEALDLIAGALRSEGLVPSGSVLSFNDEHHEGKGSQHEEGLAMDISVSDPSLYPKIIARLNQIKRELGIDFMIYDETKPKGSYAKSKAKWSGAHIHIQFYSREDARKFKEAWNRRYSSVESKPEILPSRPSSGTALMSMQGESSQTKIIKVTQPVIMPPTDSGTSSKGGGLSGGIPSSFNPSNRDILYGYV